MQSYTTVYSQVHESILIFTNLIHIHYCITKHKDRRSQSSSERLKQLFLSREEKII